MDVFSNRIIRVLIFDKSLYQELEADNEKLRHKLREQRGLSYGIVVAELIKANRRVTELEAKVHPKCRCSRCLDVPDLGTD